VSDAPEPTSAAAGSKSYLALIVSAVVAPWVVKHLGVQLDGDTQIQIAAAAVAVVGAVMRTVSKGAPLAGLRKLCRREPDALALSPDTARVLVQTMAPLIVNLVKTVLAEEVKKAKKEDSK
jgi:hypothetical protein